MHLSVTHGDSFVLASRFSTNLFHEYVLEKLKNRRTKLSLMRDDGQEIEKFRARRALWKYRMYRYLCQQQDPSGSQCVQELFLRLQNARKMFCLRAFTDFFFAPRASIQALITRIEFKVGERCKNRHLRTRMRQFRTTFWPTLTTFTRSKKNTYQQMCDRNTQPKWTERIKFMHFHLRRGASYWKWDLRDKTTFDIKNIFVKFS